MGEKKDQRKSVEAVLPEKEAKRCSSETYVRAGLGVGGGGQVGTQAASAVEAVRGTDPMRSLAWGADFSLFCAVDNEEAALLHEEATMTIEELLTRYGQNCHKGAPHSKSGAGTGEEPGSQGLNGEAGSDDPSRETSEENGPIAKAHRGLSSNSERGTEAGPGGEPGTPTGEAGPSCSSASDKLPRVAKSKFFEDSEDESDEAEEEEEDSEVRACGS